MKKFALNAFAVLALGGSLTLVSCGEEKPAPVDVEATNDSIVTVDSLVIADSVVVDSTKVNDSVVVTETSTTEKVK